jgi:ribosomal protein L25 (general stress protein Ctc)
LNYRKSGKSTSQVAFRIKLRKNNFSKRTLEKAEPFNLTFIFFKAKALYKSNQTHPYTQASNHLLSPAERAAGRKAVTISRF